MASKQPNTEINMGTICNRAVDLLCDLLDGEINIEDDETRKGANAIIANFMRRKRQVENEADDA